MSKSNFVRKIVGLSALPTIFIAKIARAAEPTQKAAEPNIPFWGSIKALIFTCAGWVWIVVQPAEGLLWLWCITFPLTLVWMIWATPETKKLLNNAGSFIPAGLIAVAVFLGLMWPIIWAVTYLLGLVMSFGWIGWKILVAATILFLLSKIPGLRTVVSWYWGKVMWLVGKIWSYNDLAKKNPGLHWEVVGSLLIAGLINGQILTNLTATEELIPGIIPGISGVVGLFFLLYRTVFGQKMVDRAMGKLPPGWWRCDLVADKPLYDEHLWETQHILQPLTNPDGSQQWEKNHKCGAVNKPEYDSCCREYCNNTPGWVCPNCGYKGEDQVIELPAEEGKEAKKPKTLVIKSKGMSWKIPQCKKCSALPPERPKKFHFPTEDLFSAPEGVLPTGGAPTQPVATAAPAPATATSAAPAVATSVATAPAEQAGIWVQCACGEMNCLHKTPQFCEVCGNKLRGLPLPEVKIKKRGTLSLYEIWLYPPS